jgi:acyl-CoA synthetase (AMP-forming)/AMP-acid ligase II
MVRERASMRPSLWSEEKHERFTDAGHWVDHTLLDYVAETADATPDRTALVDRRGRLSYGELRDAVDDLAAGLADLGVGAGDVVAHQLPNRNEGALLHLAALELGAVVNPIVDIYRGSEVRYMLEKLGTSVYVAPRRYREFDYGEMVLDMAPDLPALDHVVLLDDEGGDSGATAFESVLERGREAPAPDAEGMAPDDLSLVQFTSGTTGRPKGGMHTENTLLASQRGQVELLGLDGEDVVFTPSPIGHLTGIQHGYRLALMLGTTCVFQERWAPDRALEWIERESCTYMAGATPFVRDLALHDDLEEYDTTSLRQIMTAGAPCPAEVVRQAHESFENLTVSRGWGQTENTLTTLNPPDAPEEKLRTTDGVPYGGMETRIRKPGEFEDALPGEEGELQVRGPFLFLGYYDDPERTADSFTDDGWFRTGDKAVIDDDGYVTIKGRIKDIIIRGGENIPVREIEEYLHEHPKVADGVIVAMPDERLQERACAYVVPADADDPLTFEEMVGFLETKQIATQKLPERLEVVEELEMTASGKVQRYKLREDVAEKLGMEPVTR